LVEPSQTRVTGSVESLRVTGLQARVNVESHTKFHVLFFALKWRPICYKMAPNKLEHGAQHAMKWCSVR